jgi:hypothetical protein
MDHSFEKDSEGELNFPVILYSIYKLPPIGVRLKVQIHLLN